MSHYIHSVPNVPQSVTADPPLRKTDKVVEALNSWSIDHPRWCWQNPTEPLVKQKELKVQKAGYSLMNIFKCFICKRTVHWIYVMEPFKPTNFLRHSNNQQSLRLSYTYRLPAMAICPEHPLKPWPPPPSSLPSPPSHLVSSPPHSFSQALLPTQPPWLILTILLLRETRFANARVK